MELQREFEKFRPLTQWHALSEPAKLEFYDKFMCHEVNYFLSKRDVAFFEQTVKPVISSKIHKEFMDLYLLDSSELARYTDPYLFSLLNTFEQILFAAKSRDRDGITRPTMRSIEESAALIHANPREDDRIFAGSRYRNMVDLVSDDLMESKEDEMAREETGEAKEEMKLDEMDDDGIDEEEFDPFSFDATFMFEEQTWYNVPAANPTSGLIRPTKFWKDFALHLLDGGYLFRQMSGGASPRGSRAASPRPVRDKGAFLSPWIGYATSNINEV